jgi:hypothetical protein
VTDGPVTIAHRLLVEAVDALSAAAEAVQIVEKRHGVRSRPASRPRPDDRRSSQVGGMVHREC